MFETLFDKISINSLRYLVARLFFKSDVSVSPQQSYIRNRAIELIGKDIISAIAEKYINPDGSMPPDRQRSAAMLLSKILKGNDFTLGKIAYRAFPIEQRIEFYVSCVLYSSRCERYHGDHYSPLKSSMSTLHTYYEYYYLLIFSYAIFWLLLYKIQEINGGPQAITMGSICKSIDESLQNCQILPNN